MDNYYIINDNNRAENPCLTQGEGKKRGRRGEEKRKHRMVWRMLRVAAVLGMMMAWLMPAVAQDYSGVYYFANSASYNVNSSSTNWYMVPADDPQQNHYADAWFNNQYCNNASATGDYTGDNYGDPEQPFITTYQTDKDNAAVPSSVTVRIDNSIWIVTSSGESGYYHIIHATTGKYVVYEPPYKKAVNRKSMHLLTTTSPGENAKFAISVSGSGINIRPKSLTSGNRFFNPAGNNAARYYGTGNDYFHNGMVGVYSESGGNSVWYKETALCQAPVITYDGTNLQYNITWHGSSYDHLPADYKIHYTTDDNVQVGPNTGTEYSGPITASECILRAWVVGYGMVLSETAEENLYSGTIPPTFEVTCDDGLVMNCATEGASIYYRINNEITVLDPYNASFDGTLYEGPINSDSSVLSGCPSSCPKVYAFAHHNASASNQVDTTYRPDTEQPVITLTNETTASISFVTGATLYYTTHGDDPDPLNMVATGTTEYTGSSPLTITSLNPDDDLDLRVIAKLPDRGASCPVTVMKRPKKPSINAYRSCYGSVPEHLFTINTVSGRFYYYAIRSGADPQPATNVFIQYTSEVNFTDFYNNNPGNVVIYAYSQYPEEEGVTIVLSSISSQNYNTVYPDVPTFSYDEANLRVTINAASGATIDYTVNGTLYQSTGSSVDYTLVQGQNYVFTATAVSSGQSSCTATYHVYLPNEICSQSQLAGISLSGTYKLTCDITISGEFTSIGTTSNPFTGYFDGGGHVITGLGVPLFGVTEDAIVHDINLKEIGISQDGNVGAIVCEAKGYTRIYNCGILPTTANFPEGTHSSVAATGTNGCAGGIVGKLEDDSRVVNCFSYADVSSTGYAAGIVGNNTFASNTAVTNDKYTKLRTMVVNCMFYGDITAGSDVWPVYGGTKITNAGASAINNYNFYSDSCHFSTPLETTHNYYCSWPAKYEYLTRYEYHRYLLNSNRELCGWWVGAPYAPSTMTTANVQAVPKDASLMAKWVLDRNVAPFPILKPFGTYSSPINIDADSSWRTSANKWEGKKLGAVSVTVKSGAHHTATDVDWVIPITDMDTIHGDYCYRKIQLPYYNSVFGDSNGTTWAEKYGGNYTNFVVTGWEITSTNGAEGTFTADWQDGYNFADRYCSKKDIYNATTNPRIFAQGGYYYVPYDVTEITITAHWGNAIYLGNGDNYYDRVDFTHTNNRPGTSFAPAGVRNATLGNGQTVHTGKIATVAESLPTGGTVFDNALVLVGNHQYCTGGEDVAPSRSFTIMSADFDLDNEPDYCLEWQLGVGTTRQSICPIRFDFLPVIEIGLGLKKDGSTQYYSLGCYRPLGHYEVTETALIRFGQFEFSNKNRTVYAPLILNGGIYEQYVKGTSGNAFSSADDKINYIIIGGNVYMPNFSPGAHVNGNANFPTRHCAVNAIGGKFDNLFLTGNYNDAVTPNADNPHCYIDGGWFGQVAAAGKEGINGNVFFELNHAVVHEFYGGGTIADKRVTGNIEVTVDSSRVYKYCGGPKFGDMYENKTVTTRATGTTFGVFYGGGNGGTSYIQYDRTDGEQTVSNTFNWGGTGNLNSYTPGQYRDATTGYMADYELTITNVSTGTNSNKAIYRSYFFAAQFSATNTGDISNTLTGCKVLKNYYGGGNLGGVDGNVTSILDNTEVQGSAFGAGFSASIPSVTIYNKDKTPPSIDVYTGIITPQSGGTSTTYTWTNETSLGGTSLSTSSPGVLNPNGDEINYFFTEKPLQNLGTVSGHVSLTITGNSVIGTSGVSTTGNVYGGGDQSAVTGNTTVILQQGTHVLGNVYGGGNEGAVSGNSEVIIQNPPTP